MQAVTVLILVLSLIGATIQSPKPSGTVRIDGRAVADDRGPFPGLGASLFWALWAYKNDPARLDAQLKLLSEHNVDYIRALGVVGRQPEWAGRVIDSRWDDYDEMIAGLTDHAFDFYGLRIEWTIFGDADQMVPESADRVKLVDRFLAMTKGREHKIMHFEVANESWQNGFEGAEGMEELRALARRLDAGTAIPVAASDSEGHDCADHLGMYRGLDLQILTEHFPRSPEGPAGRWAPVIAPWEVRECKGLPAAVSNNEPIGPLSSVASESDPVKVVAAAVSSWMAGVGLYVFHTDAGVWGREAITDMPGAEAILDGLGKARSYVPGDVANWDHHRGPSAGHPFTVDGAIDTFASVKADRFFVIAIGVENGAAFAARRPLEFESIDPLTGAKSGMKTLAEGEKTSVKGSGMVVLQGKFRGPGTP
jgi:hypothetical protein